MPLLVWAAWLAVDGAVRTIRADAVGAEVIVLTHHVLSQRDAPVELYKRRLDDKGQHVLTPGLEVYHDTDLQEPLWGSRHVRVTVGQLSDSITHRFGYLAVMGRWRLHEDGAFLATLHAGPGLLYRESWRDVPEYIADNPLQESETFLPGYEYLFFVLGEVDLLYRFTPTLQGVWSIVPGIPYIIMQSFGVRWAY